MKESHTIHYLDGPYGGTTLQAARAPLYLRAARDLCTDKIDCLDQTDDEPRETEEIEVYRLDRDPTVFFADGTAPDGRRTGTRGFFCQYRHIELDPWTLQELRTRAEFGEWCRAREDENENENENETPTGS